MVFFSRCANKFFQLCHSFQYLSDIGGTAGLVLGLSLASLLKYLESCTYIILGTSAQYLQKKI